MKKTVLLYNFTPERAQLVRMTLKPLGMTTRTVTQKEFALPIGALVGQKGFHAAEKPTPDIRSFRGEMLVLGGITGEGVSIVTGALQSAGIIIPLKAIVTETNVSWSGEELYRELMLEHEAMSGRN